MTHPAPRAPHTEHGDREAARSGEILRTVVGSGVHGIAIEGTDIAAVQAHRRHWGWA